MTRRLITILMLFSMLAPVACNKENMPIQEQWEVTAILTPTGLGDMGYNDQMYLGLCYIREELGCSVVDRFPTDVDEAIGFAKEWMDQSPTEGKHRLLILCDEGYERAVRESGWKITEDNCILQLECQDGNLDIYTRAITLYGSCYAVGRLCKETLIDSNKNVAVIVSNPYDQSVNEGKNGFIAGVQKAGITVDTYYLSNDVGNGYNQSQDLYHLCYEIAPKTGFVLPLAGGSNKGVYQYGRESKDNYIWTCAMDADVSYTSYSAAYGIMKYVDQMLLDFCRRWKNGQANELHVTCGLESGYVKVEVNPYIENSWGSGMDEILHDAIECENKRL